MRCRRPLLVILDKWVKKHYLPTACTVIPRKEPFLTLTFFLSPSFFHSFAFFYGVTPELYTNATGSFVVLEQFLCSQMLCLLCLGRPVCGKGREKLVMTIKHARTAKMLTMWAERTKKLVCITDMPTHVPYLTRKCAMACYQRGRERSEWTMFALPLASSYFSSFLLFFLHLKGACV